jgi:hypothetical protein
METSNKSDFLLLYATSRILYSIFKIAPWTFILVLISTTANDIISEYDVVIKECDQQTCILKFDNSICTISFANTSIPECPYSGCIQGKEIAIGCDIEEGSQCPKTLCEYKPQPPKWVRSLNHNLDGFMIGSSVFVALSFLLDVVVLFTTINFVKSESTPRLEDEDDSIIQKKIY